jgi:hypothetical protein
MYRSHASSDLNFQILDVLLEVSRELGHLPAEVALNWAAARSFFRDHRRDQNIAARI